jgi:hypothetical protein
LQGKRRAAREGWQGKDGKAREETRVSRQGKGGKAREGRQVKARVVLLI